MRWLEGVEGEVWLMLMGVWGGFLLLNSYAYVRDPYRYHGAG